MNTAVTASSGAFSGEFSGADVAALLRIAGEAGEIAGDWQRRRVHILDGLLALIGGCSAICSEVDPQQNPGGGYWAIAGSITCSSGLTCYQRALIARYLTGRLSALDPCVPPLLGSKLPVVTVRRIDVIDSACWYRCAHYNEVRRPLRFGESIYGKLVSADGRRLKLSLHREMNDPPFTPRDVTVLHVFNENLSALYDAPPPAARVAATAAAPLIPPLQREARIASLPLRYRPVLRYLLAGDAEKQVAYKLRLSPHTVHEYVKALYRAFRVNSRSELLAQFVVSE